MNKLICCLVLFVMAPAHNCCAWWSWSPPGEHSTHHKISDAAYGLVADRLVTEFMKNPGWISSTYSIFNDINAHGGNEMRNGGNIELLFKLFLDSYNSGDTNTANTFLGYCAHLIADMHVPAHAFNIKHSGLDTGVPDLFEYTAREINPAISDSAFQPLDLQHIAEPLRFYHEAAHKTRLTIASRGFSGVYHVGTRSGEYANWNGDGFKGYYTVELGTIYESLDFDLFPSLTNSGKVLIQNQLDEAALTVGRFILAVDKLLSYSPGIRQATSTGLPFSWYGDGFVPMGMVSIYVRTPAGNEKAVSTVVVDASGHFVVSYTPDEEFPPGLYTWWAVDDVNLKISNRLTFEIAAPAQVSGTCGISNGEFVTVLPDIGLCINGTTSAVVGNGPWSWSCQGYNGGTTVFCTANFSVTELKERRDGIVVGSDKLTPDISDALAVLRYVVGTGILSSASQIHADVAPLGVDGKPVGDGVVDIADTVVILRRSIGIGSW